jgi:hypothetical protein
MGTLLRALVRKRILDRGVRNGSSLWLVVGAFSVLRRLYRMLAPKQETIRLGERLRPGDDLVVRYPGTPGRKVRKETKLVDARRTAATLAFEQERAQLAERATGKGRRARKAKRALSTLREPRV